MQTNSSGAISVSNNASAADCEWIIAPPGAVQVAIGLSSFSTQKDLGAVQVFQCEDLRCDGAQLLAELSGTYTSTRVIIAKTGFMKMTFKSDTGVTGSGFKASWNSVWCYDACKCTHETHKPESL